jgi:diguanylate cyclase (GGDEF)-like protein
MMNTTGNQVENILELASKWKLNEAMTVFDTLDPEQISDDQLLGAVRSLLQSIVAMYEGRYEVGVLGSLPAITKLVQHGYRPFLDWAYSALGFSFGILGAPETGLEWVSKAIAGAGQRSDDSQLRRSLNDEGQLFAMLDEEEKSVASFEKALALTHSTLTVSEEAKLLNNIAEAYLHFARKNEQTSDKRIELAQKAMKLAQSALDLLKNQNQDHLTAWSLENLGSALTVLGKFSEAEDAFIRALPLSESDKHIQSEVLASYALLLCEQSRYDESDSMLQRAFEQAQGGNQNATLDRIIKTRIQLEIVTGKNEQALIWSERRSRLLEDQNRKRLASMIQNSEIFVELEKARRVEQKVQAREEEIKAVTTILEKQAKFRENETLRDKLTGCLNQRGLALFSKEWFVPGKRAAFAMVAIDGFKSINDRFGHDAADKVIRAVASIFVEALRGSDLVVRFGDEEFLLVIQGVGNEAAWGTCERLRRAVESHGWGNIAPNLHVTVSIGVVVRLNDEDLETLTPKAAAALGKAKSEGHNRVIAGE